MKKISILIPAYNEEKYISTCLESLLKIGYKNYEIIVCDNGSTDKTCEKIKEYPEVVLVHEKIKGPNAARNKAFSVSKGEIVVTIDADSVPVGDWFNNAIKHFNKSGVVAVSGICKLDSKRIYSLFVFWVQKSLFFRFVHFFVHRILKKYGLMFGANAWYTRDALMKIGGFKNEIEFYGDDAHTAEMLTMVGRIIYDPKVIVLTSARRYEGNGPFRVIVKYVINYVHMWITKRPFTIPGKEEIIR